MTRDSGRHSQSGDPSGAPAEGCQSGPAKTGHRPNSGATQEIINRLKELSDKATPGEWRDDRGDILDSDGVLFEGIGLRDHDAALAVDAVNFVRSTLTNLTPSGVERTADDATQAEDYRYLFGIAQQLGYPSVLEALEALTLPSKPPQRKAGYGWRLSEAARREIDEAQSEKLRNAASLPAHTLAASELPSQGDVEGRAREMLAAEFERVGFAGAGRSIAPTDMIRASIAIRAIVKALASKEDGRS